MSINRGSALQINEVIHHAFLHMQAQGRPVPNASEVISVDHTLNHGLKVHYDLVQNEQGVYEKQHRTERLRRVQTLQLSGLTNGAKRNRTLLHVSNTMNGSVEESILVLGRDNNYHKIEPAQYSQ